MGAKVLKRPLAGVGLSFAEDARALAAGLSVAIRDHRAQAGRLAAVEVLVPHRALAEWLQAELAAQDGAVVNLRWLTSPQALIAPFAPGREGLTGAIDVVLRSPIVDSEDFAPVRSYLERDGQDEDRRALRRLTLATRLAPTLEQYAAHWPEGRAALAKQGADGRWLGALWKEVAGALALLPRTPLSVTPLFIFDVALPGYDLLEALALHGQVRGVFLRSTASVDAQHPWHRHGHLRQVGLMRWLDAGTHVAEGKPQVARTGAPSSVQLDAPSHRRAAEAIAAQVWTWVRRDKVRFPDIAVVVPDSLRDDFLPVLREVFDEAHGLPKVMWRLPLGEHNRVVALAKQLLELPSTPLRRGEVMGVLTHPLVAAAFEDDLPESWVDWVDAVGIFHGLDASSHEGTYLEGAVAADWDQGLQRLALGAFAGGERSGAVEAIAGERGLLIPEEVTQSSAPALGRMVQLVRSLLSDAVALREAHLTAAEWSAFLRAYLGTYLRPSSHDGKVRGAVIGALGIFDTCGLQGTLPWDAARTLALSALEGLRSDRGGHLLQGVVVGAPADLHGVPFQRLVFVGLEQGSFPAKSRQDELDRRPDDPEHRPDDARRADAFHFHQMVEDCGGEVCLVPIARDPLTGERREPSLLVKDLAAHVHAASKKKHEAWTRALPLHRRAQADDGEFAWAFPEARVEKAVRDVADALAVKGPPPPVATLPTEWREALGLRALPESPAEPDGVIEVTLSRLVRFLEYPTRGYAEQRLGYRGEDDERDELIDERFEHDGLTRATVAGETLYAILHGTSLKELQALSAKKDAGPFRQFLDQAYERTVRLHREAGTLPHGLFYELQKEDDLLGLHLHLLVLLEEAGFRPPYNRLKWGQGAAFDGAQVKARPPVELDISLNGKPRKVRITGVGHFISEATGALFRFKSAIRFDDKYNPGHQRFFGLAPWVEHLMLQAGGERCARLALGQGSKALLAWNFPDLAPGQAREELSRIVQGLLQERTAFVCPALGLLKHWEQVQVSEWAGREILLKKIVDEMFGFMGRDDERYSPLRRVEKLRLPTNDELESVMGRLVTFVAACEGASAVQQDANQFKKDVQTILAGAATAANRLARAEAKRHSKAVGELTDWSNAARRVAHAAAVALSRVEAFLAHSPPDEFLESLGVKARQAAAQAEKDALETEAIFEGVKANKTMPKGGKP